MGGSVRDWLMSLHRHFGSEPSGPGHAVFHDLRQPAPGVEPQQLHLDGELCDPLANDRIVGHSALAGEVLDLLEPDAHARGRRRSEAGALVHQSGDGHGPAVAHAADDVRRECALPR